jgi:hypothetical protein
MLTLVGVLLLIAFCFFASSICIAVVLASFLALLADPAVQFLERMRLPRSLAAGLIVLAGAAALTVVVYASYNKLTEFSDNFDVYADRVRRTDCPHQCAGSARARFGGRVDPRNRTQGRARGAGAGVNFWATYLARGVGSVAGSADHCGGGPFSGLFHVDRPREAVHRR